MKLTAKQKRFVDEFLIDLNAAGAARRAGYSDKTARYIGYEILAKPHIQAAVQLAKANRQEALNLDAEWVLRRFKEISDYCTDPMTYDASGANKATEMIGKHLAMFKDIKEVTGKDGGPIEHKVSRVADMTDEELKAIVEGADGK